MDMIEIDNEMEIEGWIKHRSALADQVILDTLLP